MLLPQLLECETCDLVFDHVFTAVADSLDEVHDPPSEVVACPECQTQWEATYEGWTHTNEA